MRAAPDLLGAPTIGGGSAQPGGGGGGSSRSQIAFQAARNIQRRQKMGGFKHFILANKSPKMPFLI